MPLPSLPAWVFTDKKNFTFFAGGIHRTLQNIALISYMHISTTMKTNIVSIPITNLKD